MNKTFLTAIFCIWSFGLFANSADKIYKLWYKQPTPNCGIEFRINESDRPIDLEWENSSLPIGNGYMGASIFGRTDCERIQLSDKTLHIRGLWGAQTNSSFADVYLDFYHTTYSNYERSLTLNDAISRVSYTHEGVRYSREYFASYPDNVIVIKLTADKPGKLTFGLRAKIPFLAPYGQLQRPDSITKGYLSGNTQSRFSYNGRIGKVSAQNDLMTLRGTTEYLGMIYEAQLKVIPTGGKLIASTDDEGDNGIIRVEKADSAIILITLGTNYELKETVFTGSPKNKLKGNADPHQRLSTIIKNASQKSYEQLVATHVNDYKAFFDRVYLNLGEELPALPTDKLMNLYRNGQSSPYIEELMFQYGRYLLISSSRKGTLPPLLQGVWNQYELAPWNNNYTHNINIQMNYWPAFSTNLAELFECYVDYYKAYRKLAEVRATNYVKKHNPQALSTVDGGNGWIVGAGAGPFFIGSPGGHSGPGTGGLTSKLFWDYYEFTSDDHILKEITYPAISGLAQFLSKSVRDTLGYVLAYPSSSPEQFSKKTGRPYPTLGCAFDQQMIYENYNDVIKASKILGIKHDPLIKNLKEQIEKLDPVLVGADGQIKEYREEVHYDDIALEKNHRHISHLMGLYPGTLINSNTPEWIEAAKVSLKLRGTNYTGWSLAHKLNVWARTKDANNAYKTLQDLIGKTVYDNLWTNCIAVLRTLYQIDANFGCTAGIAEMLLQSHEGYITLLPALPSAWNTGSYKGLMARGNFKIDVDWKDMKMKHATIYSGKGNLCTLNYSQIAQAKIKTAKGKSVKFKILNHDKIQFKTKSTELYYIEF